MTFNDDLFIYKQNLFAQHKRFVDSFNFPRVIYFDSIDNLVDSVLEFRSIKSTVEKLDSTNDADLLRFKNLLLSKESLYKELLINNYLSLKLSKKKSDLIKKLNGLSTISSAFNFKSDILSYLENDLLEDFKTNIDHPTRPSSIVSSLKYLVLGTSLFVAGYFLNGYLSNNFVHPKNSTTKNLSGISSTYSSQNTQFHFNKISSDNSKLSASGKTYHLNKNDLSKRSRNSSSENKTKYYHNRSSVGSSEKKIHHHFLNHVQKNTIPKPVVIDASVNYSIGHKKNN